MLKKKFAVRYFSIISFFVIAVFLYGGELLNMQIANGGKYQMQESDGTYTEKHTVFAVRGEIYDRNGVPLVTNKSEHKLIIDGKKLSDGLNRYNRQFDPPRRYQQVIIELVNLINLNGDTVNQDTLPVTLMEPEDGTQIYSYTMMSPGERDILNKFLKNNELSMVTSAESLVTYLAEKYNLNEYLPHEDRDWQLFRSVLGICYDFDRKNILQGDYTYELCLDMSKELMTVIKESSHIYPGAEIVPDYKRIYHYPSNAPHLMGEIGKIYAEELDYYLERGYSMDAIVGKSGIERAFEDYLRGRDGVLIRKYDRSGNVIAEEWAKDEDGNEIKPVPGKNVYITIDIKLQQVAELSLEKTINRIHAEAAKLPEPQKNGSGANAGGAAIINPNNGEILALPTYPSYDLSTYRNPEVYAELVADEESSPFINRATMGLYEPGSVFKIVTSVAALCENKLTPWEYIYDQGVYRKYEGEDGTGYTPACWRWNLSKRTCGSIHVSDALRYSCNFFYFTVSERIGMNTLAEYARKLGFENSTGIELGEAKGLLPTREYVESINEVWYVSHLLQGAIGQSYTLASPLQMATMLGTVANGGTRYASHLLLYVKEYGSDEIYYSYEPEVKDNINISEEHLTAIKTGLRNVIETHGGSAVSLNFPVSIGAKTGTAQTNKPSSNGAFVAFAPYESPEISMAVVIEQGAKGTWAGFATEYVFDYYFGDQSEKSFCEAMGLPYEPEETNGIEEPEEPEETNGIEEVEEVAELG